MKANLNIICKRSSAIYLKKQIFSFIKHCYAELICINEEIYWKDGRCIQFGVELRIKNYTFEEIKKAIVYFFVKLEDMICTETQESIEYASYVSIPEILQYNKVFFVLYIVKVCTKYKK